MGSRAMAGSLPSLSAWGSTWKAVQETGQWPEHSRKALLLGNMLLLVLQEFIDNKEKDTKYIWIGSKTQNMKKQWNSSEDLWVKENGWWFVEGGRLQQEQRYGALHGNITSESRLPSHRTDLVLQPQAPIQSPFHSQFQVNWLLLGTFGNRFVFCLQHQPQSQFVYVLMQRDINTHCSRWNHSQHSLTLQTMCWPPPLNVMPVT